MSTEQNRRLELIAAKSRECTQYCAEAERTMRMLPAWNQDIARYMIELHSNPGAADMLREAQAQHDRALVDFTVSMATAICIGDELSACMAKLTQLPTYNSQARSVGRPQCHPEQYPAEGSAAVEMLGRVYAAYQNNPGLYRRLSPIIMPAMVSKISRCRREQGLTR